MRRPLREKRVIHAFGHTKKGTADARSLRAMT